MNYTSQQVQQRASELSAPDGRTRDSAMLFAFAALLKSREDAKEVALANAKELEALLGDAKKHGSVVYEVDVCGRKGMHNTVPLFTHPPAESAEAKDAARYRHAVNDDLLWEDRGSGTGATRCCDGCCGGCQYHRLTTSDIDAAMTAESREGEGS
jgi:hypothetical protein